MARDTNSSLPKRNNPIGLALVLAGAILLMVSYLAGWTSSNLVLLSGFLMIVIGVIWHIRQQKRREKY
jgi:membrane-bound ClpP family serine protease